MPASDGSLVLLVQPVDDVLGQVLAIGLRGHARLDDRGVFHQLPHQTVTHLRSSGCHDLRRLETDSKRQGLVPRDVPLVPEAHLIAPRASQVLALDAQRTVIRAVHEDPAPAFQKQLPDGAVPALQRDPVPQNREQRFLDAGVASVREGRCDDPVRARRMSGLRLRQPLRTRLRLARSASCLDVPHPPVTGRGQLLGAGGLPPADHLPERDQLHLRLLGVVVYVSLRQIVKALLGSREMHAVRLAVDALERFAPRNERRDLVGSPVGIHERPELHRDSHLVLAVGAVLRHVTALRRLRYMNQSATSPITARSKRNAAGMIPNKSQSQSVALIGKPLLHTRSPCNASARSPQRGQLAPSHGGEDP